jgi:hypothetical protein
VAPADRAFRGIAYTGRSNGHSHTERASRDRHEHGAGSDGDTDHMRSTEHKWHDRQL